MSHSRGREHTLPVLSGLLLALSFPPVRLLVPVFVALVPLLLYIVGQPAGGAGRWNATRAGIITGVVYFGLQLYWIVVALLRDSLLAIPAYLGMVLVLAGLTGAFAWAVHYTRDRPRLPLALRAAVFWTMLEWVQAHLGELSFPWLGLGAALAPFPTLAAAADLVGTRGLTFWIAGINGLIASAFLLHQVRRPATRPLIALLLVVLVGAGYGLLRTSTLRMKPVARVALVQPNIPEDVKRSPAGLDSSLTALTRLTRPLEGLALDIIAWPEVALPADFQGSDRLRSQVRELSERVGIPILVGAYGVDPDDGTVYNSAFLVDPRQPPEAGPVRYDKRRLVPFIERVPFVADRWLAHRDGRQGAGEAGRGGGRAWVEGAARGGDGRRRADPARVGDVPRFGALGAGVEGPVIRHPTGGSFGILICYESIFSSLARDYRSAGADYLLNITNDAWYGREEWWGRTPALWQHPAHMVLRALETRSGVARVANTGISMLVDPLGRTYEETRLFEATVTGAVVYTTESTTLFVRWGDWFARLVVVFGGMTLLVARFRINRE